MPIDGVGVDLNAKQRFERTDGAENDNPDAGQRRGLSKKAIVAGTTVVGLGALFLAGRKGLLGESVKKLLGGKVDEFVAAAKPEPTVIPPPPPIPPVVIPPPIPPVVIPPPIPPAPPAKVKLGQKIKNGFNAALDWVCKPFKKTTPTP